MADEYPSGTDSASLKRKYEDQPTHRPTGFSSPPSHAAEIQLAKLRAQEVAARLLNCVSPGDAKRPKSDNGSAFDSFDAKPQYSDAKPQYSIPSSVPPVSYGYQGSSKKIEIPNVIIGKGGGTIKYLQVQSGAKIQVTRDMDADPNSTTRMVELMGCSDLGI